MFDDEDESRKERADAVKLMTLHASKGAEFDVVFIAGCEDGFTPKAQPNESAEEAARSSLVLRQGHESEKETVLVPCRLEGVLSKPEVRTRSPFVDAIAKR